MSKRNYRRQERLQQRPKKGMKPAEQMTASTYKSKSIFQNIVQLRLDPIWVTKFWASRRGKFTFGSEV